jgi:hypothetical protein
MKPGTMQILLANPMIVDTEEAEVLRRPMLSKGQVMFPTLRAHSGEESQHLPSAEAPHRPKDSEGV